MASVEQIISTLDHRVMFIAACASFTTLFILSLFDKLHLISSNNTNNYNGKKRKLSHYDSLKTEIYDDNEMKQEAEKEQIQVSESSLNEICKDMIISDFYIQQTVTNYFESEQYFSLIPRTKDWMNAKIKLLIKNADNYSEQMHELMMDHFDPLMIEPKSNECLNGIVNGIAMFQEWRKWKNGNDDIRGWKYRQTTKENAFVYTHSLPSSQLDIVKTVQIFPFNICVVLGVFLNNAHFKTMDPALKKLQMVKDPSPSSHIIHICVKLPAFLTDRDFLNVACIYFFKDGSCIVANVKCDNQNLCEVEKGHIRGDITLSVYHFRPDYDRNIQHTKVTFYSHVDIKGSIPSWILNSAYMETAKSVPELNKYIQSLYKKDLIHQPGQLWIPPNPFLKMMGIDIEK